MSSKSEILEASMLRHILPLTLERQVLQDEPSHLFVHLEHSCRLMKLSTAKEDEGIEMPKMGKNEKMRKSRMFS